LATNGDAEFVTAARERLAEVERDIASLQSNAARLPMDAREEASQSVEDLRSQANDVSETVMSIADAAPQEIAEQREEVADDVAALSASVRRESFELQAALEN
jgi:F0F1-type ATP synthase membrane subunit b/b'